ncbi:MerR family transcriptional regulator [Nocardiopsis sediminis]|uniref:MerR family transcriptional regulator n=1 Tax=Nocardiopsis sediminis TaxID=1778267 RepID=A0ABV8FM01_9ACTN
MAWSTRELAELAGTSLRAVRHYHEVGLLEEPERRANGYKCYGVTHLVRLMRIKRLSELGFSLAQIAEMDDTGARPDQALRTLDAELAETVRRLQRVRTELALVARRSGFTELPPEVAMAATEVGLSGAARSLAAVWTRLLGPRALESYIELLRHYKAEPADAEFTDLPADADEATRSELAERLLPISRDVLTAHPELHDPANMVSRNPKFTTETIRSALGDLFNPAQLDVLRRIERTLAREQRSLREKAG